MEAVVERENLKKALAQVKRNKGAATTVTWNEAIRPAPTQSGDKNGRP
jgi:hypothetical protein